MRSMINQKVKSRHSIKGRMGKIASWTLVMTALASNASFAEVTYTVTTTANTIDTPASLDAAKVTKDDGQGEVEMTFADIDEIPEGAVLRKRGEGYLLSSTKLGTFRHGEIRIEEGGLIVSANQQVGVANGDAPTIVVSNGASFVVSAADAKISLFNDMRLVGVGYEGRGAICFHRSDIWQDQLWQGKWCLDGDAVIRSDSASRMMMLGESGSAGIDLGGHQLYLCNGEVQSKFGFADITVSNPPETGGIVAEDNVQVFFQSVVKINGTSANELIVKKNNSTLNFYVGTVDTQWTLALSGGWQTLKLDRSNYTHGKMANENIWKGPVRFDDDISGLNVWHSGNTDNYGFTFAGPIMGNGSISVTRSHCHLYGANEFSGTLTVAGNGGDDPSAPGLAFWHPESVSPNADIKITDAPLSLVDEFNAYAIPTTEYCVNQGATAAFRGGTNVTLAALVKTGVGCLDVHSPICVTGKVELVEGTLRLARYAGAGLTGTGFAGNKETRTFWPDGTWGLQGGVKNYAMGLDNTYPKVIELLPRAFVEDGHFLWNGEGTEYDSAAVVYDGWIWNRSAETKRWTFAGGAGNQSRVMLDGDEVMCHTAYNVGAKSTVDVLPGAHHLQIRSYADAYNPAKGKTGSGPAGWSFNNLSWRIASGIPAASAGIRFDPEGRDSTDYRDYRLIEDPGDGSLLTINETGAVDTRFRSAYRFARLSASSGARLDVGGNSLTIGEMDGLIAVENSNVNYEGHMTVEDVWTIDAERLIDGDALAVAGKLTFGSHAKLKIRNGKSFVGHAGKYEIARAEGGMTGFPELNVETKYDERLSVELSSDGKSLLLTCEAPGFCIILP